jgi:hypothetical protein
MELVSELNRLLQANEDSIQRAREFNRVTD